MRFIMFVPALFVRGRYGGESFADSGECVFRYFIIGNSGFNLYKSRINSDKFLSLSEKF